MLSRDNSDKFLFQSTDYCKNILKITVSYEHSDMIQVILKVIMATAIIS